MQGPRRYSGSYKFDIDDYDLDEVEKETASADLWRGLGNWVSNRSWKTARTPDMRVCRGTDRFGLYHEFVWHSVTLPTTHLCVTLHAHVHLGPAGDGLIAGAIWATDYKNNELKREQFPELDEMAVWLQGQFPKVWNGSKG